MKKPIYILLVILGCCSCKEEAHKAIKKPTPVRQKPKAALTYRFENTKAWLATTTDSAQIRVALALNRTDRANIVKMDSILVANDMTADVAYYLPFPFHVAALHEVSKVILFSYATQTFGAYEYGELMYVGPTNMGRRHNQTPTGLFFANWKAEATTSTFDDEWNLRWNVNIENKLGVGWHQYTLPGYPASHSCLRLGEKDAKYLYNWVDQWILQDEQNVWAKGTPVIVFGTYDFDGEKPWFGLKQNPKRLNFSAEKIEKEVTSYLTAILKEQQKREEQSVKP